MKTHIIRLEPFDDVVSIRDKMSWSKAPRILLAFPKRRPPLLNRLDLVLLQRFAVQQGGQLGLVSLDGPFIPEAQSLTIPVFPSIPAAQRLPWGNLSGMPAFPRGEGTFENLEAVKTAFSTPLQSALPVWLRIGFFTLGVASLLALILFFLPQASIRIQAPAEEQSITLDVWASPEIPAVLPSGGMPAEVVSVIVEGQMETETTALVTLPSGRAAGLVLLVNLTDAAVDVPAGTIFRTVGETDIRFRSTRSVKVFPGDESQVEVQVEAVEAGSNGNVAAGSIQAVEGPVGLAVRATNPERLRGGTNTRGRAASQHDFARLYDTLVTSLAETAANELAAITADESEILTGTLILDSIVEDVRSSAPGEPADRISMRLKLEYSAWAVRQEDLRLIARAALDSGLTDDQIASEESLVVLWENQPQVIEDGPARWKVEATRQVTSNRDWERIPGLVKGLDPEIAEEQLASWLGLATMPVVELRPSWWFWMPFLTSQIQVVVQ